MTLTPDADRRRDLVRRNDPAFTMRKAEYRRAWKAMQDGDPAPMAAYRKKIREQQAARTERPERRQRAKFNAHPKQLADLAADARRDWRACVAYAETLLADPGACQATTRRGGFRASCIRRGPHWQHVSRDGGVW